ncbi:hypothetical protein [Oceanirhabdus sp. W0125-5]|uniref:hypothetical protein n=1 Tax=Oceanirhabdus sp. W0125-5 TaxID=2999116 RepID=UPI0022F30FE1|nr:hypothetical protein [Oceanirhabdus sp. W0125-5]WBW98911.1 hypothetical protein OW730_09255 [Oceanirhabdus sp. W0125-5]
MAKPSIFSENYGGNMKKRRRKRIILFLIIFVAVGSVLFLSFNDKNIDNIRAGIKNFAIFKERENDNKVAEKNEENIKENNIKEENTQKNDAEKVKADEIIDDTEKKVDIEEDIKEDEAIKKGNDEKENNELKSEYIGLGREMMITLNYKILNGKKEFISIDQEQEIESDILGNMAVINITKSQNTYLIKEDFTAVDITKPDYISTKKKTFTKEYVLGNYEDYVWCKSPKFVDENTIVYVSGLPWINSKKNLYIWTYKINEGIYTFINNSKLSGKEIIIGERDNNLIKIQVAGKDYKVDKNGIIKK